MTDGQRGLIQEVMDLACRVTALEFRVARLQPMERETTESQDEFLESLPESHGRIGEPPVKGYGGSC